MILAVQPASSITGQKRFSRPRVAGGKEHALPDGMRVRVGEKQHDPRAAGAGRRDQALGGVGDGLGGVVEGQEVRVLGGIQVFAQFLDGAGFG